MGTQSLFGHKHSARFSACRKWRLSLAIWWHGGAPGTAGKWINYLMLNPSTADEFETDATVERCVRRAMRHQDCVGITVTNLFAYMATDPEEMKRVGEAAIHPENDHEIITAVSTSAYTICGWGNHGAHLGRAAKVLAMLQEAELDHKLFALAVNGTGEPQHPLYIPYTVSPMPFGRRPCCERDTDKDGNCDLHERPGVLRMGRKPKGGSDGD